MGDGPLPRRVSMADVARLAAVSPITVSRVSNGFPGVAEDTRERVVAAMRELGYRPNSAARALKRGEFRTVGVILFTLSTTGNIRTLDAVATSAAERGYAITLIPVDARTEDDMRGAFTRLQELAVDAVVMLMGAHLIGAAAVPLPPNVPVVVVGSDVGDRYRVIDTDQAAGAHLAVHHLLDLGHPTVRHVAGPEASFSASQRAVAWREVLREAGREARPPVRGDWTSESGYHAGLRLADDPECTAVFAANDEMALGVLRALHERGRDVPGEVSVVGFDDIDVAATAIPPLTTIRQDFAEVGRRCVEEALRQVHGESGDSPQSGASGESGTSGESGASGGGPDGDGEASGWRGTSLVPVRLVTRASTAPPPR